MNSSMTLAASLAVVLVIALTIPAPAAFAATINAEIVKDALVVGEENPNNAFSPYPIEIQAGDTIVWTNKDNNIHTVSSGTPSDPTPDFGWTNFEENSPTLIFAGKTFEHTFTDEGEFLYYCTLHPQVMTGLVKVSAGGVTPTESTATAELAGNRYTVTAISADTSVKAAEIVPGQSVQVEFEGPGAVELTLPTSMISGVSAVTSGGSNVEFEEVDSSADSTTISFSVPSSGAVEITGATVVPEFGVIAALVLAVSLVAVIGFARFKSSSFGLGRF